MDAKFYLALALAVIGGALFIRHLWREHREWRRSMDHWTFLESDYRESMARKVQREEEESPNRD